MPPATTSAPDLNDTDLSDTDLSAADRDLLLADPALRWCLDADEPGFPARARAWLAQATAYQGEQQGRWLISRAADGSALAWLAEVTPSQGHDGDESSEDDQGDNDADEETPEERRLTTLLDALTEIAGEAAVNAFFDYAEAIDGLAPDVPCHTLSGLAATSAEALSDLLHMARAAVRASAVSEGLFVETADPALAQQLEDLGGTAGGQVWIADLVVRAYGWPR